MFQNTIGLYRYMVYMAIILCVRISYTSIAQQLNTVDNFLALLCIKSLFLICFYPHTFHIISLSLISPPQLSSAQLSKGIAIILQNNLLADCAPAPRLTH